MAGNTICIPSFQCVDCMARGFCSRWLIVDDNDLAKPKFIIDARNYTRKWMKDNGITPAGLVDALLNALSRYDNDFKNAMWVSVDMGWDRLFEAPNDLLFANTGEASRWRESLLDWVEWNFWREQAAGVQPQLNSPVGRARFKIITSAVRALNWHDTAVRMWGVRPANDNTPQP